MSSRRDNSTRSRFTFLVTVTYLLILIFQTLLASTYYVYAVRATNGLEVDQWEENLILEIDEYMSFVEALVFLISVISFIAWLYRLMQNVMQRSTTLRYTPLMASICWFIPFFNFFGPVALVNDLRKNINTLLVNENKKFIIPMWILILWWPLHLFRCCGSTFLKPLYKRYEANYELILLVKTIVIENLLYTAGCITLLLLIRSLSKAENVLFNS